MSKIIVITGGTSGIGLETANMLKTQGNTVIVVANDTEENVVDNVYNCDVSNAGEVEKTFQKIKTKFGKIDVLINNAGFGISGASELIPLNQISNLFSVNVMGVVNCTNNALPIMESGATIINLGSAMAFFPLPFRTMYAASKSAVVTMSYGYKLELQNYGINVCVVCRGDVKTNFTKNRVKNFSTIEKNGTRMQNAAEGLDSKENSRMPASAVAKQIVKQVNAKKPKHLVIVGTKYKVLYVLQKMFPIKWVLAVIEKHFGGYSK